MIFIRNFALVIKIWNCLWFRWFWWEIAYDDYGEKFGNGDFHKIENDDFKDKFDNDDFNEKFYIGDFDEKLLMIFTVRNFEMVILISLAMVISMRNFDEKFHTGDYDEKFSEHGRTWCRQFSSHIRGEVSQILLSI